MKNWKSSIGLKILCFMVSVCSMMGLLATGMMTAYMMEQGYYVEQKKEIKSEYFEQFHDIYQVMALTHMNDSENVVALQNTNFKYAIVEGKDIEQIDISDSKNYIDSNMTNTFPKNGINDGTVSATSWDIDENTELDYAYGIFGYVSCYWEDEPSENYEELSSITGYDDVDAENNMHHYWVVYQVQEPLQSYSNVMQEGLLKGDLYEQGSYLVDVLYQMRFVIMAVFIVSVILWLLSLAMLLVMVGHHRGEEQISGGFLTVIPLDVFAVITLMLELMLVGGAALVYSTGVMLWSVVMVVVLFVLSYGIGFAFFIDFVVRVKMGKWWRNTLCFRFCAWVTKPFRRGITVARENLSLFIKACIVLGIMAVLELFVIRITARNLDVETLMWLIWRGLTTCVLIGCLFQLDKLQKGARRMAEGNLEVPIDTSKMILEFKTHGEYLNNIRKGIDTAVVEKMKSERFKTELITNVSHDIKTPLTSIISYVDLLEKEELENPKAAEYLDVLSRQSARLKNLIEDLMEASKASTGNIEMHFEQINFMVLMSQILGEFEDRLVQQNLEVILQKPDEDIYVQADGRHLWRVFDNLLVNICKYAMQGTRVYIDVIPVKNGQCIDIVFKNISRTQLNISGDELLQRFVRGDASRNTEGSGLGLSIAQSLTELMHGKLRIDVDGDLFKVTISFPVDMISGENENKDMKC